MVISYQDAVSENPMPDAQTVEPTADQPKEADPQRKAFVEHWTRRVKQAKTYHQKAFKRMVADQEFCFAGADAAWNKAENYVANITQRHVNQRVAALYAKNPTFVAKKRERMEFSVWDEQAQSLQMAFAQVQQAQMAQQQFGQMGMAAPPGMGAPPEQAVQLLQDFQQGVARRQMLDRVSKTLALLMSYFMDESEPAMKVQMKQVVRRTCTCGVAYVKLGFQRETQGSPETMLNDHTTALDHLRGLAEQVSSKGAQPVEPAQKETLAAGLNSLMQQQTLIVREGLVFDYPASTKIIPDPLVKHLRGFVGARWIAHEMDMTPDQVRALYGVDLKQGGFTPVGQEERDRGWDSRNGDVSWGGGEASRDSGNGEEIQLARLWRVYDKEGNAAFTLCDGYCDTLDQPGPPEVEVSSFWPVFALTFNEIEHESEVYPPSDVYLIRHPQRDYNRNRQGLREHKHASRPRYIAPRGKVSEEDVYKITDPMANVILELDAVQPGDKVSDIFQPFPSTGIDPNLYETSSTMTDVQLVVGASEETFGMPSKQTATSSSIAEGSRAASVSSNIDDLDDFLSEVARSSGQILLSNMSIDQVKKIVGPGAVWPEFSADDISQEIYLEVQGGSSGQPNKALEIQNMQQIMPYLIQVPGISPQWLARQMLTRMDDKLDLTEAFVEGIPSVVAMNAMSKPQAPAGPDGAPQDQGNQGADNAPNGQEAPNGPPPAFGNNQV